MDKSSRQKINQETQALNETLGQMDLIDIYRAFHPKAAEYTFFSSAHETFSRIDHMLGHKTNLYKFKNKTIQSIFFSHHSVKLEIYYKRKLENVELKQHVTEQQRGRRINFKII